MLVENGMNITGLMNVLPKEYVLNQDLDFNTPEESAQFIEKVGINKRYIIPENQHIVYYFEEGIKRLIEKLAWKMEDVDFLCVVSQSGLGMLPSMAHQLHASLGGKSSALVWDLNLGCSAWSYAMYQAHKILQGLGKKSKAIICLGDVSSQLIDPNDNSTKFLFSDAFNVVALEYDETADPFYYSFLNPGKGVKSIYRNLDDKSQNGMILDGMEVFQYAVSLVPGELKKMEETLEQLQVKTSTIVLHQANQLINRAILSQMTPGKYRVLESIQDYGNAGIASIGLTLGVCTQDDEISDYVCACGFGVGFSIGTMAFQFTPRVNEIIKI